MIARGFMLIWRKNLVKLDCLRNDALLHSVCSVSSDKAVLHRYNIMLLLSSLTIKMLTVYIATIDGEVHKRHLIAISEGTVIEGVHCTPDNVELLPRQPDLPRPRPLLCIEEAGLKTAKLRDEKEVLDRQQRADIDAQKNLIENLQQFENWKHELESQEKQMQGRLKKLLDAVKKHDEELKRVKEEQREMKNKLQHSRLVRLSCDTCFWIP
ncbi:hypothetical protein CQW23_25287 [Capsicum baccatum]|uniref:Uncharacterized protein n=1 Tax=Capsicum baccatum TaxID=33114 RepID=A0A2G2VKK0_CAPBA|nr:hypothetical protein CQW23_25287 [Capsicum baccatum]